MANSVVHFEIFASDVARARQFCEQVFGWQFEAGGLPDFFHITAGTEADFGLKLGLLAKRSRKATADASPNAFRCTISVDSITATMAAVTVAGGELRSSVVEIPHVGKVVEIADTDGNIACILEYVAGHPLAAR
jgi:uncharacterized protein